MLKCALSTRSVGVTTSFGCPKCSSEFSRNPLLIKCPDCLTTRSEYEMAYKPQNQLRWCYYINRFPLLAKTVSLVAVVGILSQYINLQPKVSINIIENNTNPIWTKFLVQNDGSSSLMYSTSYTEFYYAEYGNAIFVQAQTVGGVVFKEDIGNINPGNYIEKMLPAAFRPPKGKIWPSLIGLAICMRVQGYKYFLVPTVYEAGLALMPQPNQPPQWVRLTCEQLRVESIRYIQARSRTAYAY